MIVASIDIGTNTVLLLIARIDKGNCSIHPLYEEQQMPRLGKGLKPNGEIEKDKVELLTQILSEYQKTIIDHNCEKIIVSATNALRIAKNSKEIIQSIKSKFNFEVNVISGELEAEYAFLGAVSSIKDFSTALIIDIGGGSTELIFGNQNEILYKKSFSIGSVSVSENYLLQSPPQKTELKKLEDHFFLLFKEIKNKLTPAVTIGIAGTVTTLACMIKNVKQFDAELIEGSKFTKIELDDLIKNLLELNPEQILDQFGEVLKGREDIITGGAIILANLMDKINSNEIFVSSRGIRYGAIAAELFSVN
jgi:exopolyphosphatase/guanosine-5'-triphosphate,3'-diphosphate pyrophosphatase